MEGLLWRETFPDGTLTYSFLEIVDKKYIYWFVRLIGGVVFLTGMCLMAYNCLMTLPRKDEAKRSAQAVNPQTA